MKALICRSLRYEGQSFVVVSGRLQIDRGLTALGYLDDLRLGLYRCRLNYYGLVASALHLHSNHLQLLGRQLYLQFS